LHCSRSTDALGISAHVLLEVAMIGHVPPL